MMEFEDHPTEPNTIIIKMPKRHIAKHSDEDLRAAVLKEREACAKLCEEFGRNLGAYKAHEDSHDDGWQDACCEIETAIRGRTE
jgi:hypothetical protein